MSVFSVAGSTPSDSGFELKSARFNDNDSAYLSSSPPIDSATGRKTWTLSWWEKKAFPNNGYVYSQGTSGNVIWIGPNSSNGELWVREVTSGGGNVFGWKTDSFYRDPSAWYHFVIAVDTTQATSGDRVKIYINGVQQTSLTAAGGGAPSQNLQTELNNNTTRYIGTYKASSGYKDGYLAEFYLLDGSALGPEFFGETNALTNQWQPTNPSTIKPTLTFGTNGFYLPFSHDALATSFEDSADHSIHTMTAHGDANTYTAEKKFGTASLQCVGTDAADFLSTPNSDDFMFGTGDFTVEYWVYTTNSGVYQYLMGQIRADGTDEFFMRLNTDSKVLFMLKGESSAKQCVGTTALSVSTWYHIAGVRDGNNLRLYIDGVLEDTEAFTSQSQMAPTVRFEVGATPYNSDGGHSGFSGYIDEFRLSNTCRYPSGTTFTPSTTAFTADKYTRLLLHMDGTNGGTSFPDSSWTGAPRHTITAVGNTKNKRISNHSVSANGDAHIIGPKVGSSAMAFDGTGDDLSVAQSSDFAPGSGDFTIEGWVYPISGSYAVILTDTCDQAASPPRAGIRFWVALNGTIEFYASTVNSSTDTIGYNSPSGSVALNKWQHIAAVRDGNTFRAYVDGIQISTLAISATSNSIPAPGPLLIGRQTTTYARMNVDEYRFSNTCRYPNGTTFTPSTTEFSPDANTKLLIHSNTTMGSTTFTDSSSTGHTITANGDVMHVANKTGTGMGVLIEGAGGTDNYLSLPASNDFSWNSFEGFTFEAWVCSTDLAAGGSSGTWGTIFNSSSGGTNYGLGFDSSGTIYFWYWNGSSVGSAASTSDLVLNTWTHVAVVKSGTNLLVFMDGTLESTTAITGTPSIGNHVFWIGRNTSSEEFAGYLDEVRISHTARYTSTFSTTTTPFKDDKDTALLLHMDGGGGIDADTNLPTFPGQGTYFWDASTNAIFYGADGIPTNKSLISYDGSGDYLSTPGSTDFAFTGEFTIEMWANGDDWNADSQVLICYGGGGGSGRNSYQFWYMGQDSPEAFVFYCSFDGNNWTTITEATTLALSQWYHIAVTRDSSNVVHIWLNGTELGSGTSAAGTLWTPTTYNTFSIGGKTHGNIEEFEGRMDQVRISNSARYTSAFTPSTTPFTADANTKLLVQSDWSEGGLGADHSGNYNYWTPTNLTADDMMIDSPKNTVGGNFCTWNPLWGRTSKMPVLSEGNLVGASSDAAQTPISATFAGIESGKWYWEIEIKAKGGSDCKIGLVNSSGQMSDVNQSNHYYRLYLADTGNKFSDTNASTVAYGNTYAAGDIVGIALDMDNGALYFAKNGTWQTSGDPTSGATKTGAAYTDVLSAVPAGGKGGGYGWAPYVDASDTTVRYAANFGADSSFAGEKTAQGNQDGNDKGDFYYTPPTGYLALCSDNLPVPSIELPGEHFNTVLYTGDGSSIAVTGVGFQPDFTWIKNTEALQDHTLVDAVRGATKYIVSNDTDIEVTNSAVVASLDSDGFTVGTINSSNTKQYVGWNWKGDGVSGGTLNEDGSIDSYVNVNTIAGFSIVKYTSPGTNNDETIGHGLSQRPDMVIVKNLDTTFNWDVWSPFLSSGHDLRLNTNDAQTSGRWSTTIPTASLVTLKDDYEVEGTDEYIAYCFHSVEGYSKVGTFEGVSSTDGPWVYLGFKPAYILLKNWGANGHWNISDSVQDPDNPVMEYIYANSTDHNTPYANWDFLSNGFKMRINDSYWNTGGNNYLYYAVAESPFKTSNAR